MRERPRRGRVESMAEPSREDIEPGADGLGSNTLAGLNKRRRAFRTSSASGLLASSRACFPSFYTGRVPVSVEHRPR
jgi:hypothetical protein